MRRVERAGLISNIIKYYAEMIDLSVMLDEEAANNKDIKAFNRWSI
jgi:hypothetical protein